MKKPEHPIDDLLRQLAEGSAIQPGPEAWNRLNMRLESRTNRSRLRIWISISTLAAACLAFLLIWNLPTTPSSNLAVNQSGMETIQVPASLDESNLYVQAARLAGEIYPGNKDRNYQL